jgi:hypothetical protein
MDRSDISEALSAVNAPPPFLLSLNNRFFILIILSICVLLSCRKTEEKEEEFKPNTGQIQILNACGVSGAAETMRDYLTNKGFDIVEFGNARYWNFSETIVVARTENTIIARDLAKLLNTENFIQLIDSSRMVDATVYVGKDYYKRIRKKD